MVGVRTSKAPQERRDRSAEVMEAAIAVFFEKGYADASMQDVAERVGVLKGSLYHYTSSKEDLLYNVLSRSHEEARQIMEQVEQTDGPADDRLCLYLSLMANWYLSNVERVSIYFKEGDKITGKRADPFRHQRRDALRFLRALLDAAKESGSVREDIDTRLASLMVYGQLNSFPDWYKRRGPYSAARVSAAFVHACFAALSVAVPDVPRLDVDPGAAARPSTPRPAPAP